MKRNQSTLGQFFKREALFISAFVLIIIGLVVFLRLVIGPFILALVLAYVFNPWIESLERRGIGRSWVIGSAIAVLGLSTAMAFWVLLPTLLKQAEQMVKMLPAILEYIEKTWIPPIFHFLRNYLPLRGPINIPQLSDFYEFNPEKPAAALLNSVANSTRFIFGWTIALILAPAFAFFVMRDFRRIMMRVLALVPPDLRTMFLKFTRDADNTLRAVLRGQILLISSLMLLYASAFFIAGLPAGIVIGLVTGIVRIVPYMDLVIGGTLSFLVLISSNSPPQVGFGVLLSFALIQLLDAIILTPRIMGQFSGLHPFIIIVSVLCFGDWFGFYGVLLAIPMAAVLRVTLISLTEAYKKSDFYRNP